MSYNNKLSDFQNFNTENIIFSKPEIGNIPGQKINFKRIRIACKNQDSSIGDLILSTPEKLHSFGLQESKDMATDKLNGYVLPICLWNRNGPSENEKKFTDLFNQISEYCKTFLLNNKEEIEKYDLDYADLKKFNPLFWKQEKGKIVEGKGPMLYCKVLLNKKNNKINTIFVDEESNREIDPFKVLNKPCTVTAAIKFESIFIGNKISLQVKLYEVVVRPIDNSIRGLLRPNASKSTLDISTGDNGIGKPIPVNVFDCIGHDEEDEDDDSIKDGNEVEEEESDDDSIIEETQVTSIPIEPPSVEPQMDPEPEPVVKKGRGGRKTVATKIK